jgi:hypothetical protein
MVIVAFEKCKFLLHFLTFSLGKRQSVPDDIRIGRILQDTLPTDSRAKYQTSVEESLQASEMDFEARKSAN